jgi:membrane protein DedA with SNARE-associated domain
MTGHDAATVHAPPRAPRWIVRVSVALVVARLALPFVAVPLIPVLITDRIGLLVLLRPQKEFLLLAGAQSRVLGNPSIMVIVAAWVPFMLVAVWAFFVVGRAYRDVLDDDARPTWLRRAVPERQLAIARSVLVRRGPWIAVLGRLAAMPPTVLAAAAGTSDVDRRHYLMADAIGAVLALSLAVSAGWVLGEAWERAGPWLTGVGAVLLVALVVVLTRWLRREAAHVSAT